MPTRTSSVGKEIYVHIKHRKIWEVQKIKWNYRLCFYMKANAEHNFYCAPKSRKKLQQSEKRHQKCLTITTNELEFQWKAAVNETAVNFTTSKLRCSICPRDKWPQLINYSIQRHSQTADGPLLLPQVRSYDIQIYIKIHSYIFIAPFSQRNIFVCVVELKMDEAEDWLLHPSQALAVVGQKG